MLARLARAHLIESAPGLAGRWRMHDLVALYARRLSDEHAAADGREQAIDRLLGYYLDMSAAADLWAQPGMDVPGVFAGQKEALAWLDAERASLIPAVQMAADTGRDQAAMRLPILLGQYLLQRCRLDDWVAITILSADAARRLGDQSNEATARTILGLALHTVRSFDEVITAYQEDLAICRETGDRHREGRALGDLGVALYELRRFDEAITACQDAVTIYRETGDSQREGRALTYLGIALYELRRFDEAITACQDAVTIYRETGDERGERIALHNLEEARAAQLA